MKLIGLTGGIGSGKSTVAKMLREHGWMVYCSDETAREIMNTDPAVRKEIADLLGEDVLTVDGTDRALIASLVFGDTEDHKIRLDALDQIIHPRVMERHLEIIEEEHERGTPLMAIETALLFEVGLEDGFDWVIVVDAPEEKRVAWVAERSGMTAEQVRLRISEQMSVQEKRSMADFVVENTSTIEELQNTVNKIATILDAMPDPGDE